MIRATDNGGDDPAVYMKTLTQFANLYAGDFSWKLIALHGYDGGKCTCHKGGQCPSPGKHPIMSQWDASATNDPEVIVPRIKEHPGGNLGVLLGPESGIIDIEFDTDQGRATAEKLFADIVTPTYESARSRHYLFKWSPRLPMVQKLEPKHGILAGLEIRIGNGDKATQSVVPPSRHHSGAVYKWLDGMSPGMVDVAPLPREVLGAIINYDPGHDKAGPGKGLDAVKQETVSEGGRNETLFRFACWLAGQSRNIAAFGEQQTILHVVECVNVAKCRPPLPDHEVKTLVESAIFAERSGQAKRNEELNVEDIPEQARPATYEAMGIDFDDVQFTYRPGSWQLEIVQADPMFYRLRVPAFCTLIPGNEKSIKIPAEAIDQPNVVARLIRVGTGGHMVVNPFPSQWETIWKGRKPTKKDGGCEGLFSQLIQAAKTVDGDDYEKTWILVTEYLIRKLRGAYPATKKQHGKREVEKVYDEDTPTRFSNGDVYFKWQTVFDDGLNAKTFSKEDISKLTVSLGMNRPERKRTVKLEDGRTARLALLPESEISRLELSLYGEAVEDIAESDTEG